MPFIDFSKSFDRVHHTILLNKFSNLGIPNFLVGWLTSFLFKRRQRIKLGSVTSEWSNIKAGVLQGTLINPIGFLLHINYQHRPTICSTVKHVNESSRWEVCTADFTTASCKVSVQAFWHRKKNVEQIATSKQLGIVISENLTWDAHVDCLYAQCSQRLYLLILYKRAGVTVRDILSAYKAMILSSLKCACQVWHTSLTRDRHEKLEFIHAASDRSNNTPQPVAPQGLGSQLRGKALVEVRQYL